MNAVTMLKMDHEKVRKLFQEYGAAGDRLSEKQDTAQQALMELEIHSKLEEEIFYPAVREKAGDLKEQIEAGFEEHAQVDRMIEQLKALNPSSDAFADQFQALMGAVEYHVAEEEAEMLPKAEQELGADVDRLGEQMAQRKEQLLKELMPAGGRAGA